MQGFGAIVTSTLTKEIDDDRIDPHTHADPGTHTIDQQ